MRVTVWLNMLSLEKQLTPQFIRKAYGTPAAPSFHDLCTLPIETTKLMDGKLHCGAAFAAVVSAESLAFPGRVFQDVSGNEVWIHRSTWAWHPVRWFQPSESRHPQSPLAVLRSSQHAPEAAKMWVLATKACTTFLSVIRLDRISSNMIIMIAL